MIILKIIGWLLFTGGICFMALFAFAHAVDSSGGEDILGVIGLLILPIVWILGTKVLFFGKSKDNN